MARRKDRTIIGNTIRGCKTTPTAFNVRVTKDVAGNYISISDGQVRWVMETTEIIAAIYNRPQKREEEE